MKGNYNKKKNNNKKNFKHYLNNITTLFDDFTIDSEHSYISEQKEEDDDNYFDFNKSYDFINLQQSKQSKKTKNITNKVIQKDNINLDKKLNDVIFENINNNNQNKTIQYSSLKRQIYSNLIFRYFYDKFDKDDNNKAYIILFLGQKGEGKTKAINAYFNLIKGIKLEKKEKIILIDDKIGNNQLDNGIHMYYIKDIHKNPLILIDCIGYGDKKNNEIDDKLNEAFKNLFGYLIKKINLICYVIKENDEIIKKYNRYVIGCITGLFSEDILNNFIFLITDIDRNNIVQRPQISITLYNDIYYDYIKYKMGKKWFYSINSESIFTNEVNELSKYSYEQLNELNNDKVLNSKKISIRQSLEIINCRLNIKNLVNNIISKFKILKEENSKIPNLEKNINSCNNLIETMNSVINNSKNNLYIYNDNEKTYNIELSDLETQHTKKIKDLDNEYETSTKIELESSYYKHTICTWCKRNCHKYCDCVGGIFNRCTVFPVFGNDCEECGHHKNWHTLHTYQQYVDKTEEKKNQNNDKKREENERYYRRKNEINSKINQNKYNKEKVQKELEKLNKEKNSYQSSKNNYVNERNNLNNNMKKKNKEISEMISNLIDISGKIQSNALNKFQFEIENDYIDLLIDEIKKKDNNKEKIEKLMKRKQNNIVYKELSSNYFYLFGFKYGSKF